MDAPEPIEASPSAGERAEAGSDSDGERDGGVTATVAAAAAAAAAKVTAVPAEAPWPPKDDYDMRKRCAHVTKAWITPQSPLDYPNPGGDKRPANEGL